MIVLWLSLAGGLGALSRFITDGLIRTVVGRQFPWATILINVSGSLVLGILTGLVLYHHGNEDIKLILGTGFCGGYTTFSTASFEAVRLIEKRRFLSSFFHVLANMGLALIAAWLGLWLAR